MKTHETLLAKTKKPSEQLWPETTLVGHTERVLNAAVVILDIFRQSGPPEVIEKHWRRFSQLVVVAAGLHDIGKATNVFQGMLTGDNLLRRKMHPVRHEVLSALLIAHLENPLAAWLRTALRNWGENFHWAVSWVAGGHHLKLHRDQPHLKKATDRLVRLQGVPREYVFMGAHPDLRDIVGLTAKWGQLEADLPELFDISISLDEFDDAGPSLGLIVDGYVERSVQLSSILSEEESFTLACAKAILIAADVAGSALWRERSDPLHWIMQALSNVIKPEKMQGIIDGTLKGSNLHPFQEAVESSSSPVTLTIAGCGNGKTLAAYCWARQRAAGRKLFFCYPTTGTASAGFEDYLLAQSDLERALIHGRSTIDLERILQGDDDLLEENQRLQSMQAWWQEVIACTVDTVLGLIQNQRRALFSFPALAMSAFVFDEIHNYDAKLFGALLTFLHSFPQAPVLLMSASIPNNRLDALRKTLGDRLSAPIPGDEAIEGLDRYVLTWRDTTSDCWGEVIGALRENLKVLWVCNTVGGAVSIWEEAVSLDLPVQPMIYHSRFRYEDRVHRQAAVINAFREAEPTLVIATQVCEMSLNISCDLMVSALAPFPSLIQRLGRLNRYSRREPGRPEPSPRQCIIHDFNCRNNQPYPSEELLEARRALNTLWETPCSQMALSKVLKDLQQGQDLKTSSAWLDGKWETYQRPLRESGTSITVVMARDVPEILQQLKNKGVKPNSQNVAAWTIPMLFAPGMNFEERLGGYCVASDLDIEYHEQKGARWRRESWSIY